MESLIAEYVLEIEQKTYNLFELEAQKKVQEDERKGYQQLFISAQETIQTFKDLRDEDQMIRVEMSSKYTILEINKVEMEKQLAFQMQ